MFDIESPVFELPFSNNPQTLEEKRTGEERFTFAMGRLTLSNYIQDDSPADC